MANQSSTVKLPPRSSGALPLKGRSNGGGGVGFALAALALLAACGGELVPAAGAQTAPPVDVDPQTQALAAGAAYAEVRGVAGDYLEGQVALGEGDVFRAADALGRALRAEPSDLELRRQVFLLRLAAGRYDQAIEDAKRLLELDSEANEARLLLALADLRAERFEQVQERAAELAGDLGRLLSPFVEAWAYQAQGEVDAALASLEDPAEPDGLEDVRAYHAASVLALAGREGEARDRLEPLLEEGQVEPVRLVVALASILARAGDEDAAVSLLEEQTALVGGSDVYAEALERLEEGETPRLPMQGANEGVADALFTLAQAFRDSQVGWQALVLVRLAAYLAPDDGDVALLLGRTLLAEGQPQAAVEALARVADDSPHALRAGLTRAEALESLDEIEEAVDLLENLAEARPARTEALVTMGDVLRRQERNEEAAEAYAQALDRIDELRDEHWRLLYAQGIAFEQTDRWEEAEDAFLQALELEPDQPFVLNYLGYSWVDQGMNLERAEEMLAKAVELRPNDGFIVDSIGWAFYKLGRYDEAVERLERAVELEADDPVINDHLGDAYWKVGRKREARFQWERVLNFDPEDELAEQVESKLENGLEG